MAGKYEISVDLSGFAVMKMFEAGLSDTRNSLHRWNLKVYHPVYKTLHLVPVLKQISSLHPDTPFLYDTFAIRSS